jgi:hypothetical protein
VIERVTDNSTFSRPLRKLVEKSLRADPLDPQARLWKLDLAARSWGYSSAASRAELQSILEEAGRRRDEATIRKVRQILRDLDHPLPIPNPLESDFEDAESDDDEFDDDFEPEIGPPPNVSPAMLAKMEALIETLRTAPPSVIRELRKTVSREIPPVLFDALLELAKSGGELSPPQPMPSPKPVRPSPPAPKPKSRRPEPPATDPNQLNFF